MANKKDETVEEKNDAPVEETSEEKTAQETAGEEDASLVESLVDAVTETASDVAEAVVETAGDVADVVSETASDVVETAADVVETVTGAGDEQSSEENGTRVGKRAEKVGIVYSDKMTNTVVVRVNRMVKHQLYHKYMKKRKKFMAHDELGAGVGDRVRIVETRPLSAKKRWRVVEILQKAEK